MTFKQTERKTKNDAKLLATNMRTTITCLVLLGNYNKMSDKAIIKHYSRNNNYFPVTPKKCGVWLK